MLCLQKILNIDNLCNRIYLLRRKWVNISTAAINGFKNNIYIISFWGLSINYVTYLFFRFLTPPSSLVTHFTKYPYRVTSPFGRSPSPKYLGDVIYGWPLATCKIYYNRHVYETPAYIYIVILSSQAKL